MKTNRFIPIVVAAALVAILASNQEAVAGSGEGRVLNAVFGALTPSGEAEGVKNWLGVKVQTLPLRMDEDEPPVPAAEVMDVVPGSPAAKAGLRKGDIIVAAEMLPFEKSGDFDRALSGVPAGGRLSLQLVRSGEPMELVVTKEEK